MKIVPVFENSDNSKVERNAGWEQKLADHRPQYASPSFPRLELELQVNNPLATTTTAVLKTTHTL